MPRSFTTGNGHLQVSQNLRFNCQAPKGNDANQLLQTACERYKKVLSQPDGLLPEARTKEAAAGQLNTVLVIVKKDNTKLDDKTDESYDLRVSQNGEAIITANSVFGAFRGLETFAQLVRRTGKESYLPGVPLQIQDSPSYAHRGLMLDTARTYFSVDDIKRQLNAMAVAKMNVLHWHIVDSQSFPLVSEVHPELSEKGAYSPDMIYTKRDVQGIIQYARERGIRVIPEFDTPAHTYAWSLSHPDLLVCGKNEPWDKVAAEPPSGQLDPTNPGSIKLVGELLREQATWFTDPYMHVGGDEVNQKCYTDQPHIAQHMQEKGINATQLIAGFAQQLHNITRESGKVPVTWEEALLEYKVDMGKDTIVQVWTTADHVKEVVKKDLRAIVSPANFWYLDCGQGGWVNTAKGFNSWCDPFKSWQHIYTYDPLTNLTGTGNDDKSHPNILGGEVALWTEKTDSLILDMKLWPRAAAAGEVLWSGRRDINGNERTTVNAQPRIFKLRRRLVQHGLRPDLISMLWCELHPGGCELEL
ncbi:glycoside hydrolase superfamily [Thamnocephalis sphaerospora]|uniref:Beta-hexosaminidase n=1 Tax=Thamnocephalis sphaerospora TaxID=78915 RepID=A0A4P9XFP3_9FUNG|nr:glycoside hydrolase superfamily [Thamnocephalis sphaerospora]|eukprot:RKP04423.1 glycoside hydrolase superfamily [Thamnocephalis sphaerospora]